MKQKLKQVGLFAILTALTLSLTAGFVGDVEASPQSRGELPTSEAGQSVKAEQRAAATPEVKAEAPRSESNNKLPASGEPELSIKEKQRAQALDKLTVDASISLQQVMVFDSATKAGTDFVITGDATTFAVVYAVVNPANIDLGNVEILVTSDTESVKGELNRGYDHKHATISVEIDAVDPASVNAEIIG